MPNYPKNISFNNPDEFDFLSPEEQTVLLDWCDSLGKISTINKKHSSYALKHIFSSSSNGFYISNGTFKGAMLKLGYKYQPIVNGINWYFNISEKCLKSLIKEKFRK